MRTSKIVRFVVLLAAISLAACRGSNPNAPSPTPPPTPIPNPGPGPGPGPDPTPEPPKYPVLPHRECAKNLETGEELPGCRMWAELQLGVKPPRGSAVKIGDQYCPDPKSTCLEFDITYVFKGVDNPHVGMRVTAYWSLDGKTPVSEPISEWFFMPGEWPKHFGPRIFQMAPKYLLVRFDHSQGCGSCDPAEEGWVAFIFDYKEG